MCSIDASVAGSAGVSTDSTMSGASVFSMGAAPGVKPMTVSSVGVGVVADSLLDEDYLPGTERTWPIFSIVEEVKLFTDMRSLCLTLSFFAIVQGLSPFFTV